MLKHCSSPVNEKASLKVQEMNASDLFHRMRTNAGVLGYIPPEDYESFQVNHSESVHFRFA